MEFLRELHQGGDLTGLLRLVLRHALSLVPAAQSGTVLVLDEEAGVFRFAAAEGWDLAALSRIAIPQDRLLQSRLPLDRPSVIRKPLVQNVSSLGEDLAEAIAALGPVEAILSSPVTDGAKLLAVVNLDSRDDPEAFRDADVRRLKGAWEEIALAVIAARSQAELREREGLLRLLFERMSDGVVITASDGTILYANAAAAQQVGYSQDELRGTNFGSLLASPGSYSPEGVLAQLRTEGVLTREVEKRRKDGTTIWTECSVVRVEHRGAPALLSVSRDITDRKRLEAGRAAHVAALEALAQAAPQISAARTPREAVERIVAAARELTGADHANVLLFGPTSDLVQTFDPYGAPPIPVEIRKRGFSHWILETGQTLVLDDVRPDGTTSPEVLGDDGAPIPASRRLTAEGIRSLVGFPLTVGGVRRGILYVHSRRPGTLRPHIPILSLLAAQAAVALDNVHLYEDLRRREVSLQALFDHSPIPLWIKDLSAVKERLDELRARGVADLPSYLARHPEFAAEALQLVQVAAANRAALAVYGVETLDELKRRLPEPPPPEAIALWTDELRALWAGQRAFEGEGMDRTADGRTLHIRTRWQVLPGHEERWDRVLVSVLDLTARVEAERALRRRDAVLQAAAFAAESFLREPHFDRAIPGVLAELGKATEVSRVYLFREHEDERGRPVVSQRYEWVAPGVTPQIDNPALQNLSFPEAGLARWAEVLGRGEPLHGRVADLPAEERPLLQAQEIRSIAIVPIRVRGERWGFLGFDDCVQERIWTEGELEALRVTAEALGTAIQRSELERELRRRQAELEGLFRVAASLGEHLDLDELFARVHHELARLLPFDAFLLALILPGGRELRIAYGFEKGEKIPEVVVPLVPEGSLTAWVATHRVPLLIRDAQEEWDRLPAAVQRIGDFVRSWVGVPLIAGDEVVGVLSVQSVAPHVYDEEDAVLLQAVAAPVAVALRNAQAFADRARLEWKLRELERASGRMQLAASPQDLYRIALDLARNVLGYGPCAVLAPEGDELVVVAGHEELAWAQGLRLRLDGPGVTVAAFRARELLYVPDVRVEPRYVQANPDVRSELALPLVAGGRVLGVLDVHSHHEDGIPPQDRDLLAILASQLATALAGLARLRSLEALGDKLGRLHEASRRLSRASTEEAVCQEAAEALVGVLGFEHVNIGLGRGDLLVPVVSKGAITTRARPFKKGEGVAGRVWERGETLWGNIEDLPMALPVSPEIRAVIGVPVGSRGVIQVVATHRDAFTSDDARLVEILARHVEEELRRVELERELREQAIRDPLTGLYNRRFLTEVLAREVERAKRYEHPLTLVMADIDDFKAINDRYGHGVGDEVLRRVAEVLQENVRAGDFVFRYGGEEFVILLPQTGNGGGEVVHRLRERLAGITLDADPGLRVSASLGHAVWDPSRDGPTSPEVLLHRADEVLYEMKRRRGGR